MGKNLFNSIKMTKPNKNVFDLSHDVKLSLNMGELVPTMCTECVPGDKFNISCESLLRFSPLVSPVMHRMDVTMHYFFVPNRLLWPKWEKYITNTPEPLLLPAFPTVAIGAGYYGPLADYLGIPAPIGGNIEQVSALPFAAYALIYNEYYRDQNLSTAITSSVIDGDNSGLLDLSLQNRAWEHDYFTGSLPFAQKGNPVTFPLSVEDFKVSMLVNAPGEVGVEATWDNVATTIPPQAYARTEESDFLGGSSGKLFVKGSDVVGDTSINDLRRAFRLQEWLEKAARGGSRYVENILAHFGVRSSDKRMQRPEYITGTKSPVQISEVLNTTGTEDAPQGNMAGHAVSVTSGQYGDYFCEEHGYIIGIMSVMPKTAYQQGIPKHFLKHNDPFQFFWPSFAHIGEQEVQNREIYAFQGSAGNDTFGYVPRYAEYKFENSRVAGDFRTTLDFWHLGRIFATPPALNQAFIECVPDNRIFAVTDPSVQKLYAHVLHKVRAVRSMPKFGTPQF